MSAQVTIGQAALIAAWLSDYALTLSARGDERRAADVAATAEKLGEDLDSCDD